ncbi:MAG: glycerate kinase [Corynebacterium sp.]|uniref:glycerate kinase n=1 Tax=Corynebacterium sp. TaxID=1720 RepID=UPI0026DD388A|nr:glycerate kinase [Corynebacterium sp.]MDO4762077.1 glycerate kinase [Corynebacterium sp.]
MRILIAPDSFKGTATAPEAAHMLSTALAAELAHRGINADITTCPMADGGEGTSTIFHGQRITLPTVDANGRLTEASYTFDPDTATAYIDVAAASGLPAVQDQLQPRTADTFGTGVLIADAQTRGATRITLGLGGSATIDGGTGILVALGATPLNAAGHPLRQGGAALVDLDSIDTAQLNIPAAAVEWVLLADVTNPATGNSGAAHTFGPQKGASAQDVTALEAGIAKLCEVCNVDPSIAGLGAAGAIPVSIVWLSTLLHGSADHVHLVPGATVVADSVGLAEAVAQADVVITGEGCFDPQSLSGKVVGEVLKVCAAASTPQCFVVAGAFSADVPGAHAIELIDADITAQLSDAAAQIAALIV